MIGLYLCQGYAATKMQIAFDHHLDQNSDGYLSQKDGDWVNHIIT